MKKSNIKHLLTKFVWGCLRGIKIKDIKCLWIDIIQVRNCFIN